MDDYVVDTNVWIMSDKLISELTDLEEIECYQTCLEWLQAFTEGQKRLVLDMQWRILKKYRENIRSSGYTADLLNKLHSQPINRFVMLQIEYDQDEEYAIVPDILSDSGFDPEDRKFVAVALAHNPRPPIFNATDTDWYKDKELFMQLQININELCPRCIELYLQRKKK